MGDYYSKHSKEYIESTFKLDMSSIYSMFEKYIKPKSRILDLGFGSGRDSLYFQNKGYEVYSIDIEDDFIKRGQEIGLKHVYKASIIDFKLPVKFDSIFACASLVHIPSKDLNDVFTNMINHLKPNGIIYASFKLGEFEGIRDGRYYTDMTSSKFKRIIYLNKHIANFCKTVGSKNTKWLNIFIKK